MAERAPSTRKIGVFDSGFGGLTVLRALLPRIPGAHYMYLGDTARLPYGAKSQATIARYAVESARFLESHGCEFLVIACNTATALALEDIRRAVQSPVLGVIEPGARAAHDALTAAILSGAAGGLRGVTAPSLRTLSASQIDVLVLATEATVQAHAYRAACSRLGLRASEFACPLLVPLVEEGWIDHAVTRDVLRIYLGEALRLGAPRAVLLGCTHYPLLKSAITTMLRELGSDALVIDSADATASAASMLLLEDGAAASCSPVEGPPPSLAEFAIDGAAAREPAIATFECFATDSVKKFKRLGSLFLQQPLEEVHHLDLGG